MWQFLEHYQYARRVTLMIMEGKEHIPAGSVDFADKSPWSVRWSHCCLAHFGPILDNHYLWPHEDNGVSHLLMI